jgi:surfactin synthase thioesterase subunit
MSRALSPDLDVLAVQYPGRQDRQAEPMIDSVHGLAEVLADIIEPWADRPLTLFGHSMGASVAFELALRLQERGIVVSGLFASGRSAPIVARDDRVHERDDTGLLAEMRRLAGTDSVLLDDPEMQAMILPSLRNDYRAAETYRYRPGPPITAPIVALTGDNDPRTTVEEARRWSEHTAGPFELAVFPGGHFFLNDHVPAIIDRVRAFTARQG